MREQGASREGRGTRGLRGPRSLCTLQLSYGSRGRFHSAFFPHCMASSPCQVHTGVARGEQLSTNNPRSTLKLNSHTCRHQGGTPLPEFTAKKPPHMPSPRNTHLLREKPGGPSPPALCCSPAVPEVKAPWGPQYTRPMWGPLPSGYMIPPEVVSLSHEHQHGGTQVLSERVRSGEMWLHPQHPMQVPLTQLLVHPGSSATLSGDLENGASGQPVFGTVELVPAWDIRGYHSMDSSCRREQAGCEFCSGELPLAS